jgi:integrase
MAAVSLTDVAVRSATCETGTRRQIFDAKVSGLCLRVSAGGLKTWSFIYRPRNGGAQRRLTIGTYPAWSLADAREKALSLKKAVQDNQDPARERKAERASLTVAGLIDRYIEKRARVHLKSWQAYEASLKRDVAPILGDRKATAIVRTDVADLLDQLSAKSGTVSNRTHAMLSAMFSWAVSEGLVETNPVAGLKKRAEEKAKDRTLTDDEIRQLIPALDAMGEPYGTAFLIVLYTGCRPGEAAGIEGREIDAKAATWTIAAARSKNKRPHVIPLVGAGGDIIRGLAAKGTTAALLAKPRGGTPNAQDLSQAFHRLPNGTLASHATPHDLRRTAATILERLEIDRLHVAAVLNHHSVVKGGITGSVYSQHDFLPQKRRALEALDSELLRITMGVERASNVVAIKGARP